jgi:lipopolysaccharide/colanic/teichoic acid biosynthesis glycosyltransferase
MADRKASQGKRHVPAVASVRLRTAVGFALVVICTVVAAAIFEAGSPWSPLLVNVLSWAIAAWMTHKYVHKYPQRYTTYLLAAHLKAAFVMAFLLLIASVIAGPAVISERALWTAFGLFVFADALVSAFRREEELGRHVEVRGQPTKGDTESAETELHFSIDRGGVLERLRYEVPNSVLGSVEGILPDEHRGESAVRFLDRESEANLDAGAEPAAVAVAERRLNDIHHLDEYLRLCANGVAMGGYAFVRYAPFEGVEATLRRRFGRVLYGPAAVLHFLWYQAIPKTPVLGSIQYLITRKGNRVLSKAEAWGRLAYAGMHVVLESDEGRERHLVARRVRQPVHSGRPSYYPIIALQKVGLDGVPIYLHKLRSMFPYSEFLQKRLYEEHGLTSTGKFANDFRITRFGSFVRKYWLDELPQLLDWMRGDVKLVGMRATSPHYLGLYPPEVRDLYIKVKPGLIPPIFDESTNGFDQIVEVEYDYLRQYLDRPFRTDTVYFFRTWTDILRRGVRGK